MLTRTLAQELWPYNISVNELIPGPVVTEMAADSPQREGSVFNIESESIRGGSGAVGTLSGHSAGRGAFGSELQPDAAG